jgi:hypothetical protein
LPEQVHGGAADGDDQIGFLAVVKSIEIIDVPGRHAFLCGVCGGERAQINVQEFRRAPMKLGANVHRDQLGIAD